MIQSSDLLDSLLESSAADGYLQYASAADPDQRYLSGFESVDPFTSLYADETLFLLVRGLDKELAKTESDTTNVRIPAEYDRNALAERYEEGEVTARVIQRFCGEMDVATVLVPPQFPFGLAEHLRSLGITVTVDEPATIPEIRAIKSPNEIEAICNAQKATEAAMETVESLLRRSEVANGLLTLDGELLTSEAIKTEIELTLVKHGCQLSETIVAGGKQGANPHDRGSGPLPVNEPIVVDIFPQEKESKYHADMTRTFCVGEPTAEVSERYDLTREAQEAAFSCIEPGVTGEEVHNAVCDVYEEAGFPTSRSNPGTSIGFTHGTGHGVGLEIHEGPRVSNGGGVLEPGHVITIEPGIYEPAVGGIRIEDLLVITTDGFENLTTYPKDLVV